MIRIQHAAAALAAGAALSVPALAQDGQFHAGVGYNHIMLEDVDLGSVVFRGGWDFHQNFGVEAEGQFGILEDDVSGVDVNLEYAFGVFAKAQAEVGEGVTVFGRVGYFTAELDANGFGSDSEDGIAAGVGGEWEFSPNNAVRAEYTRWEFDDGDADTIGVSYVRRF